MSFCDWLSKRTGRKVSLPSEEQWEWACRSGSDRAFWFGGANDDFSRFANLADVRFSRGLVRDGKQITGGLEHLMLEGALLAGTRGDDGHVVTAPVGSYQPTAWGLYDMHGNAAEWSRTDEPGDGSNARKVVRGGSFFDPPRRARSAFRAAYHPWQRLAFVGFRIVVEE